MRACVCMCVLSRVIVCVCVCPCVNVGRNIVKTDKIKKHLKKNR